MFDKVLSVLVPDPGDASTDGFLLSPNICRLRERASARTTPPRQAILRIAATTARLISLNTTPCLIHNDSPGSYLRLLKARLMTTKEHFSTTSSV
jgi:hypothetical protein